MKSVTKKESSRSLSIVASLTVVVGLGLFSVLDRASAAIDGSLFRLGWHALAYPGSTPNNSQSIRINGIDVSYRVQTIEVPLSEVWAHYAGTCGAKPTSSHPLAPVLRALAARGAVTDSQAYVACLDLARDDLASIVHLAGRVAETWDLSLLGSLRYVYARKDSADPSQTLVFAMWVDGPLSLRNFVVSEDIDVPGGDLVHVPRPVASHRVLSVRESSRALVVYRVPRGGPDALVRWYAERFRERAWHVVARSGHDWVSIDRSQLVVAEKETLTASVIASATEDGSSIVTVFESEAL